MDALGSCLMMSWMASSIAPVNALLGYIDPGSGSLVFQIVVAGLLTAGLMLRGLRDRALILLCLPLKLFRSPAADATNRTVAHSAAATSSERRTSTNRPTIKKAA